MKIEGLDYNTQREKLVMPEYGREVQDMVNLCVTLKTKDERQACAETIVAIMERMFPQSKEGNDYQQKLWDHLAIMSDFKLDIDWPYDISGYRYAITDMSFLKFSNGSKRCRKAKNVMNLYVSLQIR